MTNVTLKDVTNILTGAGTINENSERIEAAFQRSLSRLPEDGSNQMETLLDMNQYPIINLPKADRPGMPVTYDQLDPGTQEVVVVPVGPDELTNDPERLKEMSNKILVEDGNTIQDAISVAKTPIDLLQTTKEFPVGSIIRTSDGFLYQVAPDDAIDAHVETAGGVKLYVVPSQDGLDPRALGAPANGVDDDAPYFERAWQITKKVRPSVGCRYLWASVIGLPDQSLYAAEAFQLLGWGAHIILDGAAAGDALLTSASAKADPESTANLFTGKVDILGAQVTQRSTSTMLNGDRLYNVRVNYCHFQGIHAIAKSYRAKSGHDNGYFQSLYIEHNHIVDCDWIIHGYKGYNVVVSSNDCERCLGGIYLLDPSQIFSAHNLRVTNNLFEGGGQFMRVGNTIAGVFTGNYLEKNTIGDMPTAKCNIDLRYANTQPFDNRGSWVIGGNSFQNDSSQTSDPDFEDIKFDQGIENVAFIGGDWTNARLTTAPVYNVQGTYNRLSGSTPFILNRSPQSAGRDYFQSSTIRPLSNFLSGNNFGYLRLQFGNYIAAIEHRPITLDLSVKLEAENDNGEVFAVAAFDAKILLSPVGSGNFDATGRSTSWQVNQIVYNLIQQDAGLNIDTSTSTVTGRMFPVPANFAPGTIGRTGTYIDIRVAGFVTPTVTGRSPITRVRTHISGWANGLSRLPGTASKFFSLIN